MSSFYHYSVSNIEFSKLSIFSGYQVLFEIKGNQYQMLIGGENFDFPLNIIHRFNQDQTCPLCERYTLTYPGGQQPCTALLQHKMSLFDLFQKKYTAKQKKFHTL